MLWIEANNYSLLGKNIPHSTLAIKSDCIRSRDPRSVWLYNQLLKEEYKRMGIIKNMQNLKKDRKKFKKGTLAPHKLDNYEDHTS